MNDWKKLLPYAGLPVVMAGLGLVKAARLEGIDLLLMEVVAAFGYVAMIDDLQRHQVSNKLVLAMLGAWVLVMVPQLFWRTENALPLLVNGAVGFAVAGALFLLVYYVSRKGLGGGDVKFMAAAGLYLGLNGVLPTMLYGSILAALTGGLLILLKKIGKKDPIPLIPFLYVGMVLSILTR